MGAYGGQRIFRGCRNFNTLTNYLDYQGVAPETKTAVQRAWLDQFHDQPPAAVIEEATDHYNQLLDTAYEALYAALNVDKRALVYLPAPEQTIIIQTAAPRNRRTHICKVAATVRSNRQEAHVYMLTSIDEIDRVEAALGTSYAVFDAPAPVTVEEEIARL